MLGDFSLLLGNLGLFRVILVYLACFWVYLDLFRVIWDILGESGTHRHTKYS